MNLKKRTTKLVLKNKPQLHSLSLRFINCFFMDKLFLYYFQILAPLPFMYFVAKSGDSNLFVMLLIIYIIYRFFIDYFKLRNKGILKKMHALTFFFLHYKYFRELYLEP
jgi:hypothetical protein